ncbi:hypothetical protein MKW92_019294, partial [Papaver armeniacum]
GKTKMMPQNRKKSDGADNDDKEIVPGATNAIMFDEDMVVCILSRIPAKSLTQFKCVSKPWRSLIKDPYFADLHFTRSKTLLRFFIIPTKISGIDYQDHQVYFKTTAGLSSGGSGIVASNIPTIRNLRLARCTEIIGAVNGLLCFVYGYDNAACIYNISTREITPWIKSTVLMESGKVILCDNDDDIFMVAFDVGNEKFRTIQISKFRSGSKPSEVNGCVAILRRNTADTANLWAYEDSDKESTSGYVFSYCWWSGSNHPETHLMNSDGRSKAVSVYSYDLKKKFFEEIKISGIPLSIPVCF